MGGEKELKQLLHRFATAGLVDKNVAELLNCFSSSILGIGLGEQGFVTSLEDVINVLESTVKTGDNTVYTLEYPRVEVLRPAENFAIICADVQVNAEKRGKEQKVIRSRFQQSLTVILEQGEWKICGLHASQPVITEEDIEAYPLKFAEKTLRSLREKIGEQTYLAEEQYRRAVLADTVAFYIMNFTRDCIEQCQLQGDICAYADQGTPYQQFILDKSPDYIFEDDIELFLRSLSLNSIEQAFQAGEGEVSCTYRMKVTDGRYVWMKTTVRLIEDFVTGDKKGIMYVKNIDEEMRTAAAIREKAEYDSMTQVLNKGTMIQRMDSLLKQTCPSAGGVFLMIDVDDFKRINDNYGHPAGDQVLIRIAKLLREGFAPPALIGRMGGDEFCMFLHGAQIDEAMKQKIEGLLDGVRHISLPETPGIHCSVSVGAACMTGCKFKEIYRAADAALYEAKRAGKNAAVYR